MWTRRVITISLGFTVLLTTQGGSDAQCTTRRRASFRRALSTIKRRELGKGNCDTGCQNNKGCDVGYICYERVPGDAIPTCCTSGELVFSPDEDNYCVTAACANYTDDPLNPYPLENIDDDYFKGGPMIANCEKGCVGTSDCAGGLTCFQREKGDATPKCCPDVTSKGSSDNYCVPYDCSNLPPTQTVDCSDGAALDLGGLCFSGETEVIVWGKGSVLMKELHVGDHVLAGNNEYQPVYAFAHIDQTRRAKFLQIYTNTTTKPLEVTSEHLVYVEGRGPVRADSVKEGDNLQVITSRGATITKIRQVYRNGLYAPLTADGTILVNQGILVSTYIAAQTQADSHATLASVGPIPFLRQAHLAHLWLSPLRLVCPGVEWLCRTHNSEGKLYYVDWGLRLVRFMDKQPLVAQLLVLMASLVFLAVPLAIEIALGTPFWAAALSILVISSIRWLGTRQFSKRKVA